MQDHIRDLLIGPPMRLGRDKLHKILYTHAMVIRQGRQTPQTTDSNHRLQKHRTGGPA